MKCVSVCLLMFVALIGSGQESMKDFFTNKTQVVFLGLDFSLCKFIGKDKFPQPEGLKSHAIKEWNRFLATEPKKYSLQNAFGLKDKYYYNSINYFQKRNQEINVADNIIDGTYSITAEEVEKNVASYNTFEKEGLAVSFIVESFDDPKEEAHFWVVYIDLPENRIIYMEKMIGKPGGLGQVNFWARAVYDVVSQIEQKAEELKSK